MKNRRYRRNRKRAFRKFYAEPYESDKPVLRVDPDGNTVVSYRTELKLRIEKGTMIQRIKASDV